jgi:hypothetical protein
MDEHDALKQRLMQVELAYAEKAPVMEAAYAMSSESNLRMFDSLIPILQPKHHADLGVK